LRKGNKVSQQSKVQKFDFMFYENKTDTPAIFTFRCSFSDKEEFEHVCRDILGEKPSTVMRKLMKDFLRVSRQGL